MISSIEKSDVPVMHAEEFIEKYNVIKRNLVRGKVKVEN